MADFDKYCPKSVNVCTLLRCYLEQVELQNPEWYLEDETASLLFNLKVLSNLVFPYSHVLDVTVQDRNLEYVEEKILQYLLP